MFYFYRQTYLLYYLRKNFFLFLFTKNNINIFFYLFWVYYYIKFFLLKYNKFLINFRYFSRIYFAIKTNKVICFFYLKRKEKNIKKLWNYLYISFFFKKIFLYHYYIKIFFKRYFFLQKNYFLLKNYFFSKISFRHNFFELFWTLFNIIPKHWSKKKMITKSLFKKKKKSSKWFSYLFTVSSNIDTFFNMDKENFFLILAKKNYLKKTFKTFKTFNTKVKRFKRQIIHNFVRIFKKNTLNKVRWRRFAWFFKLKRKKKFLKIPRRLKYMYTENFEIKRWKFKLFHKKIFKKKRRYKIVKLLRVKFAKKKFNLLQRSTRYQLKFNFSTNFSVLRKILIFLSSSTSSQTLMRISIPYSLFSNFRLMYTIFSDTNFITNLLYVNRFQRYYILFNYIKSRFLKKNISTALYSFMFNSNVIYYFFIPKICRNLLLKIYKKKKLFGFSWIFFTQLNNLFLNLFSSNLFLSLNFSVSEGLSKGYLNQMFNIFLSFNPPKSKYHFLKELCDIYILTGITKDSHLLHCWIIKNLSIIFFRRHWQFLGFLKMTLLYIFKILQQSFGIKGIFITFRGKIGQVGSVRKKAYFLRHGVHTLSNLSLKSSFNTSITKTDTGAIGVSVFLFY